MSGITLSLYGTSGRLNLFDSLAAARRRGEKIAFDTNFRPRGWPDLDEARAAYRQAFAGADFIIASLEDTELLFGPTGRQEIEAHSPRAEIVLKLAEPACVVYAEGQDRRALRRSLLWTLSIRRPPATAFAAAYLAARLAGRSPDSAAEAGHRLAGEVIRHHGAIIPRSAMPS